MAIAAAVVLVILLVVGQLVLPGIAERRVRDELEAVGTVSNVEVSSLPAVKLLFGEIDSLAARVGASESSDQELADLIARAEDIDRLRVSAESIRVSGLELTDARLAKDGERLTAEASLSERDLITLLPPGTEIRSIVSRGGELLLEGTFTVVGVELSGPARVAPQDGAIVLTPEAAPLAGLAQVTVFSDDRVKIARIGARDAGGRLLLEAGGRLAAG